MPRRSPPAWTSTACWCSTTSTSPTRRNSRSAATSARWSRRPATSRRGTSAGCRWTSTTSPTSTRTTRCWRATIGGGCSAWATGCGTRTVRSRRCRRSIRCCRRGASRRAGGNTEFADMRAAYDALDDETKAECENLICEHSQLVLAQHPGLYRLHRRRTPQVRAGAATPGAPPSGRPAASRCSWRRMPARSSAGRCRRRAPSCAT